MIEFKINNKYNIVPCKNRQNLHTINFKGHTGIESYDRDGISVLKHETAFFRDIQTKKFATQYIKEQFAYKKDINIVVGACSTGEEAITLSMMLDSLKYRVNILGIDLGEKAIEQANRRKYLLKKVDITDILAQEVFEKYKDSYLWYGSNLPLFPEEIKLKKMFKKFFIRANDQSEDEKRTFMDCVGKMEKLFVNVKKSNILQLKKGKAENCKYIVGDIMNLSRLNDGKKADAIFFSNALYHLTTTETSYDRKIRPDYKRTINKLAKVFKENLNTGGIVCFGEKEESQGIDMKALKEIMEKNGFKTARIPKKNDTMLPDSLFLKDKNNFTENVFIKVD